MPTHKFTTEILHAALIGFEQQKKTIDNQIAEIRQILSGGGTPTQESDATPGPTKRKRRMSAAGRKAIAEAQRKRWAATRAATQTPEPAATRKAAVKKATAKKATLKKAVTKKAAKKAPLKTAAKKAPTKKKAAKAPEQAAPAAQ